MNNLGRAASLLDDHDLDFDYGSGHHPRNIERAQALADAGLLTPDPQIIRTIEELEAIDPDTVVVLMQGGIAFTGGIIAASNAGYDEESALPAVVVATGAQVRAARTALQEDTP